MITFRKLGRFGRFGNQLFQYSGTRFYAETNGLDYALPHWVGCDVFDNIKSWSGIRKAKSLLLPTVQLDDVASYGNLDKIKYILGIKNRLPDTTSIKDLYRLSRDNINIFGYMQDEYSLKLLTDNKSKFLEWFKFKKQIDETYKELTKDIGAWVCIHIRRGDLVKRNLVLPTSQYIETINKIREGRNLYVATDDPGLRKELAGLGVVNIKNTLPEIPEYIFDFWMIKNAQTVVGSGSTFAWWGAYLGNQNDYYSPPLTHLWQNDKEIKIMKHNI